MDESKAARVDALLYGAAAVYAAIVALTWSIPLQRDWGTIATGVYAAGAVVAVLVALTRWAPGRRAVARVALCAAVFAGATIAPMAVEIAQRANPGPLAHAQSETLVTEAAARAFVQGHDPYTAVYDRGYLATWTRGTQTHFPYMPGMLLFGMPQAIGGPHRRFDARIGFLLVALAAAGGALALSGGGRNAKLRAVQFLVVLPTGASYLAGGGDDVTVVALMILALVLAERRRTAAGALLAGAAAGIKQTAWPLLPFLLVVVWRRDGAAAFRRFALAAGAVAAAVAAPFVAWNPGAFYEDVIWFPLGSGTDPTLAASPTLGRLLVDGFPNARTALTIVIVGIVIAATLGLLVRRPPSSATDAARQCALVMAVAILLAPAGRFGYLLYPINLVVSGSLILDRRRAESAAEERATGSLAPPVPARSRRTTP